MTVDLSNQPQPLTGLARVRTPVIWCLVAIGWALLFADTLDIRAANLDDVDATRWIASGHFWEKVRAWERFDGRYYGPAVFTPYWLLEMIKPPWLFQTARLGLVAVTLWLLGRLAVKITGSTELRQLWWLVWIGVLQIPPTFYALLSYPYYHCGLILMLLAALSFWKELEQPTASGLPWKSGLLFFAGLQFHESFLVFALLFVALWIWQTPAGRHRETWRMLVPTAAAAIVYLTLYLGYRFFHPPAYEGTQAGSSVKGMAMYVLRYTAASLPGFELIIDRDLNHPALVPAAEIARRLATLNLWRVPWAVAVGAGSAWLLVTTTWTHTRRYSLRLAAGSAALGVLCLCPAALSAKYQAFAYRRYYPHAYNFYTVHFAWLAVAVLCLAAVAAWPPHSRPRLVTAVVLGAGFGLICLVAQVTNPLALQQIRQTVAHAP